MQITIKPHQTQLTQEETLRMEKRIHFALGRFVGVAKSLATDGGKDITHCISVWCKMRFGLFTRLSGLTTP